MLSRADRRHVELALRVVGLAGLVALLAGAFLRARPGVVPLTGGLDRALARWTAAVPRDTVVVTFRVAPSPETRTWLAALRVAGMSLRWRGAPAPLAAELSAAVDPLGGPVLRVATHGEPVRVLDRLGVMDSVPAGSRAATLVPGRPAERLTVAGAGATAVPDAAPVAPRRIVVLGQAGWESRFVTVALEERGWEVDVLLRLGPGNDVRQGRPLPLDTARHGAVIVLDSVPLAVGRQVARFVREGGGVVVRGVLPPGAGLRLPGRFGETVRPPLLATSVSSPADLAYRPIRDLADDVVPLDVADGEVLVAARREHAGRIVQVGYEETWRWRMTGGDEAPDDHRAWWSRLVAAVAYRPIDFSTGADADPAPLAAQHAALGPPAGALPGEGSSPLAAHLLILAVAVACLMAEWASRRLRGAA